MVILWLATMSSLAALRVAFRIPVVIETFNEKRSLEKREIVAGHTYLSIMVAAAILAALQMYVLPQHNAFSITLLNSTKQASFRSNASSIRLPCTQPPLVEYPAQYERRENGTWSTTATASATD
jgi:hypothetical protein